MRLKNLILFVTVLFATEFDIESCPEFWERYPNRHCYYAYPLERTWSSANSLCEVSGGYLAALNEVDYNEIEWLQLLCGLDTDAQCWTSGTSGGYPEIACGVEGSPCAYPQSVEALMSAYPNDSQALVLNGRTGILSPVEQTELRTFICEANLKDMSETDVASNAIIPAWVFFLILGLFSLGLVYSFTQKPQNTTCFGDHQEKSDKE